MQGADQIKEKYPQALRVFIAPPSVEELTHRVLKRKENSQEELKLRTEKALKEMERGNSFDHYLSNIDIQETIKKLKKIIDEYLKAV